MSDESVAVQRKATNRHPRRRRRAEDSRLQNWIDQAYTTLLVRDLFAKIAPGVVLLCAAAVAVRGRQGALMLVDLSTRSIAIPGGLLAVAWVLGMTIQIAGTRSRRVTAPTPTARSSDVPAQPRREQKPRLWTEGVPGDEAHHRIRIKVMRRVRVGDRVHRERLVVAKEAGGNLFMALTCSIPLVLSGLCLFPTFVGEREQSVLRDAWTGLGASAMFAVAAWACLQLNRHMAVRQRSVEMDILAGHGIATAEYRSLHRERGLAANEPWDDCKLCEEERRCATSPKP